jgi:hypothetical protein
MTAPKLSEEDFIAEHEQEMDAYFSKQPRVK